MKHILEYKTILLIGSSGLLGSAFIEALKDTSFNILNPSRKELNFTQSDQVKVYASEHNFDVIIHCGAYTQVDAAESNSEICNQVNIEGLRNLVDLGIPIITFSTDYVFDGTQKSYTEDASRSPLNAYGVSKAKAEKLLEASNFPWWNIRTSWLYGKGGKNFVDTIVQKIKNEEPLKVVDDQFGRLTNAQDLAELVVEQFLKTVPPVGHYHLQGNGEAASWYEIVECIQERLGTSQPLKSITSESLNLPAKRPRFSVLENTKLAESLPDWRESLKSYLSENHGKSLR